MSSELFAAAWARTGAAEGGYVNDPNDAGGETNHGITVAVARAHGYEGDMKGLTEAQAIAIAKQAYWDVLSLDTIGANSAAVANELFDTGFLCGIGVAGTFLQRALNLFNRQDLPQPSYPTVSEDGNVGKMTVYAFQQYMSLRAAGGEVVLLRCLNCQQGAYFMELCKRRPADDKFVFGWFLNRVVI